jgi:hypothetical protein
MADRQDTPSPLIDLLGLDEKTEKKRKFNRSGVSLSFIYIHKRECDEKIQASCVWHSNKSDD